MREKKTNKHFCESHKISDLDNVDFDNRFSRSNCCNQCYVGNNGGCAKFGATSISCY